MKRIKMTKVTFEEGFEEFLFDCKSRNLREDTLEHYRQGYKLIIKYLNKDIRISDITKNSYENFIVKVKTMKILIHKRFIRMQEI